MAAEISDSHHRFCPSNDEFPAKSCERHVCLADKWHVVILGLPERMQRRRSESSSALRTITVFLPFLMPWTTLFVRTHRFRSTDFSDSVESSFVSSLANLRIKIATGTGYRNCQQGSCQSSRNGSFLLPRVLTNVRRRCSVSFRWGQNQIEV